MNAKVNNYFERTGRLTRVQGSIHAHLPAAIGEFLWVRDSAGQLIPAEAIGFDTDNVQIMPLIANCKLQKDDLVIATGQEMTIPVGPELLGRVLDAMAQPIDGKGNLVTDQKVSLKMLAPNPLQRTEIEQPFETGIRAIDSLLTIGRGQRVGIFAGSGVGKSTLLGNIARHAESDVNIVSLVGERGREVRPFIEKSLGDGIKKSVLIVSTSDESALARVRSVDTAIAIADWFRSSGKNVLLMMDSITRYATAQRELGLLLGEPPTSRGYPPRVFQQMACKLEQMGTSSTGSITALITVLVDGDDMNNPVADSARSILDGHIVLDRKIAERGHFPAIDVLASVSRLAKNLVPDSHNQQATTVRSTLALYREVEDLINIGAYHQGNNLRSDHAIACMPRVIQFLTQNGEKVGFAESRELLSKLSSECRVSSAGSDQ